MTAWDEAWRTWRHTVCWTESPECRCLGEEPFCSASCFIKTGSSSVLVWPWHFYRPSRLTALLVAWTDCGGTGCRCYWSRCSDQKTFPLQSTLFRGEQRPQPGGKTHADNWFDYLVHTLSCIIPTVRPWWMKNVMSQMEINVFFALWMATKSSWMCAFCSRHTVLIIWYLPLLSLSLQLFSSRTF